MTLRIVLLYLECFSSSDLRVLCNGGQMSISPLCRASLRNGGSDLSRDSWEVTGRTESRSGCGRCAFQWALLLAGNGKILACQGRCSQAMLMGVYTSVLEAKCRLQRRLQ